MSLRLAVLTLALSFALGAETAIVNARIVDGTGRPAYRGSVLIRDDKLAAVAPSLELQDGWTVIDAEGKTLLPGLFDLHTHLPYAPVSGFSGGWVKHLAAYLYCGVTSVVEFGSSPAMFEPMRRLLAEGTVEGPHIHFAARIAPPLGHGMEGGRGDYFTYEVSSPEDAKAVIDELLPYKPDALKLFTDGWRYGYASPMASMTRETIAAAAEKGHRHGLEVLTHTVTVDGAKDAAAAGVDVIDHGVSDGPVDEELIRLLLDNHVVYTPTLAVFHPKGRDILDPLLEAVTEPGAREHVRPPLRPPTAHAKLAEAYEDPTSPRALRWKYLLENNKTLHDRGVTFGVGTDAGVTNTWHGWATLRELRLLVLGGLTPLEALTAATGTSAKALHVDDERGTIAAGKLADLLLVDGSPDENIDDILRTDAVFLGGRQLDREGLARLIATENDAPLPARTVAPRIDDNELGERSSRIGTAWVNATDPGLEHAKIMMQRTIKRPGDHALTVLATMSHEDETWAAAYLPLTPGGVEPADISEYAGIRFETRGDGEYELMISTRGVRDYDYHYAKFSGIGRWRQVEIPFSDLEQRNGSKPFTGKDAETLMFRIERKPGESAWLELDDIELYKSRGR